MQSPCSVAAIWNTLRHKHFRPANTTNTNVDYLNCDWMSNSYQNFAIIVLNLWFSDENSVQVNRWQKPLRLHSITNWKPHNWLCNDSWQFTHSLAFYLVSTHMRHVFLSQSFDVCVHVYSCVWATDEYLFWVIFSFSLRIPLNLWWEMSLWWIFFVYIRTVWNLNRQMTQSMNRTMNILCILGGGEIVSRQVDESIATNDLKVLRLQHHCSVA